MSETKRKLRNSKQTDLSEKEGAIFRLTLPVRLVATLEWLSGLRA